MAILTVDQLRKVFGTFVAVDSISFSLKEGEILGLLGPNGAGKTTTIQMLLGVLLPTSGKITAFGKEFSQNRAEILEKMNFSSTYTNLPWSLSVWENLKYSSYLYNISHRQERVKEIIEAFRLEKLVNLEMSQLSAGQLTRVNLAKAFINKPKILLLDEPTASLDPEVASYIRKYILEQREKNGLSIVFTSHNMPEVEEVCDRVMFINGGKIIADDTPAKLARSLDFCRVHLQVKKGDEKKLEAFCGKHGLKWTQEEITHLVEMKETQLADFLQALAKQGIPFTEISIDKPNLEDYFLKVAGENTNKEDEL